MVLDKKSLKADALANLYRAAYYLAKGQTSTSRLLLARAQKILNFNLDLDASRSDLYWAEKILDQYQKQKVQ
ncbi:MAG: hypothetical protein ABH807_00785 [Candidatus Shapirobacteria bacterium]